MELACFKVVPACPLRPIPNVEVPSALFLYKVSFLHSGSQCSLYFDCYMVHSLVGAVTTVAVVTTVAEIATAATVAMVFTVDLANPVEP